MLPSRDGPQLGLAAAERNARSANLWWEPRLAGALVDPFRELMALPETLRYMVDTIGDDLRFEGLTGITIPKAAKDRFCTEAAWAADLEQGFFHRVEQGRIRNGEMAIAYLLSDVNPGDGAAVYREATRPTFSVRGRCAAWKWAFVRHAG